MQRWTRLVAAAAAATAIACGSDLSSPLDHGTAATNGTKPDSTGGNGGNGGQETSNGPVASVTISPQTVTIPMGYYATLTATARDAAGIRVVKAATWRSSNTAVAVASDTGIVYGKATGTAKIYATVDGHTDSATVTVTQGPPPPNQPGAVAEFNMTVVALGRLPGADTSRTERVAGATVTLVRTGGISGDTLANPVDAGSGTTDANGEAKFPRLPGGFYSIRVSPPSGSVYSATSTAIAAPRQSEITVYTTMPR